MLELVGIERETFYGMQADFDKFACEMKAMLSRTTGNWHIPRLIVKFSISLRMYKPS